MEETGIFYKESPFIPVAGWKAVASLISVYLYGKAITLKNLVKTTSKNSLLLELLQLSGCLSIPKVPLEQTVTGFDCIRFLLKPFCVFAPRGVKRIQLAGIHKEQVAVHGTKCTVKCTNDPSEI